MTEHDVLWPWSEERDPEPPRPARRPRRRRRWLVLLLALVVLLGTWTGYANWALKGAGTGTPVSVVIPKGATAADAARILAEKGVVRAGWIFRVYLRLKGLGEDLQAGTYRLRTNMPYAVALGALNTGPLPAATSRTTIPEGLTVEQTAAVVARDLGIGERAFLRAAESGRFRAKIMPRGVKNLEGFLFPKTYDFKRRAGAGAVVERLVEQFDRETADVGWSRAKRLGITPYEAVIVASLIEREAKVAKDRRLISAVIRNRLERGMRLQIDATVQYAILQQTGSYKARLTFEDYEIRSDYNTYRIDGLPPAPIASPGLAAIQAALDPADVDYLFYVLNENGEHAFAKTFEEFQRLKTQAS